LRQDHGAAQQIRFTEAADGVRIAYATAGQGPPLVKAAHWLGHLEREWCSPLWRPWLTGMAQRRTLVRYDERGCGLSDRNIASNAFEDWVRDLETVVDACGLERFALTGMSQGGPVAIAYAARHPERVSHLVLYGTYLRGRPKWHGPPERAQETETLLQLIELGWGRSGSPYAELFASLFLDRPDDEQRREFTELQSLSASQETALDINRALDELDVTDIARDLSVPTLVLHARGDARIPFEEGRRTASTIPGARLVALDGGSHILQEGEPAFVQFFNALESFLDAPAPTGRTASDPAATLTQRQFQVLELIASGADNAAIAGQLFLESVHRAEPHYADLREARRPQPRRGDSSGPRCRFGASLPPLGGSQVPPTSRSGEPDPASGREHAPIHRSTECRTLEAVRHDVQPTAQKEDFMRHVLRLAAALLIAVPAGIHAQTAAGSDAERLIASALSAAPTSVSAGATVMMMDGTVLRQGTNGWTCIPDDAAVPNDSPMCLDAVWLEFMDAYMNRRSPAKTGVGFAYMLQGDMPVSNTDPYATGPEPGNQWIQDGVPHIMLIVSDLRLLESLPTDPHNGGPWVMWKGTPYAHIMVPAPQLREPHGH
jgi:pimeloyl-ACP methyl ester carboxylesterase